MRYLEVTGEEYRDRVYGCWLGKNSGGTLGAPLERAWGQREPFDVWWYPELREGGIPNDDLEMQLVWLKALEEVGPGLRAVDLVGYWLDHIGYNFDEYGLSKTNMRLGLLPPVCGAFNNWFRDCMGSPIRSEIWACVAPGLPRVAARYAYEDAICDHAGGEGVWGEMFHAAVEASAFVVRDREALLEVGLSYVPPWSKVRVAIEAVLEARARGLGWLEAREEVLRVVGHPVAQYAPINLGFEVIGWLWGEDFGDALCKAVNCGYDTDCTGATLGAILGILSGRQGLPSRWVEPLGEGIATNESWGGIKHVSGSHPVPRDLGELTERVVRVAQRVLAWHGVPGGRVPVPEDHHELMADEGIRELWERDPMSYEVEGTSLRYRVSYPEGPAYVGRTKRLRVELTNPHPEALAIGCELVLGGRSYGRRELEVEGQGSAHLEWEVNPPEWEGNRLLGYLACEPVGRPAEPGVPLVLVRGRRWEWALAMDGGASGWRECWAEGNRLPLEVLPAGWREAYLRGRVLVPRDLRVRLGVPASCPVRAWVDGALVVDVGDEGPIRPNYSGYGGYYVDLELARGEHEVLLGFVRGGGEPEAHLVLSLPDRLYAGDTAVVWV